MTLPKEEKLKLICPYCPYCGIPLVYTAEGVWICLRCNYVK